MPTTNKPVRRCITCKQIFVTTTDQTECGCKFKMTPTQAGEFIAEKLSGTCTSIVHALSMSYMDEGLQNNTEFCAAIDAKIFCCEECDWWNELSEMASEGRSNGICHDCYNSEPDEL